MSGDLNNLGKEPDKPAPTNRWQELQAAKRAAKKKNEKWTLDAWKRPDPADTPVKAPLSANGYPPNVGATPYAMAALNDEAAELAAMKPDSGRNSRLNLALWRMGRHVGAGTISASFVRSALEQAAQAAKLPQHEINTCLRDADDGALNVGQTNPRHPPNNQPNIPPVTAFGTTTEPAEPGRSLKLTAASTIKVRPVRWIWQQRIPAGAMTLLGGREGVGKSTIGYTLAADITHGRLPGEHHGTPKAVIVAATEDSWEHTIVPRLMAAGADLDQVYRVDVETYEGVETTISLPRDLAALEDAVRQVDAALILLDPLMSRLGSQLDTHKDAEVRLALEPLTALAGRTGAAVIGLIHVNKSHSTDPLTTLMASRAFAAVARAVLFVIRDPDDDDTRLLGSPKNNLGRDDQPSLTFRIESAHVTTTDEGEVWTGRVEWLGEREQTIHEALEAAGETADTRSATSEAVDWLSDHLAAAGGTDDSATIKQEGKTAGHAARTLGYARQRIKATIDQSGFPRRTYWSLPATLPRQSCQPVGESNLSSTTSTTGQNDPLVVPVVPVVPVVQPPREGDTTATKSPADHATSPAHTVGTCLRCHQPNSHLTGHDRRGRQVCTDCTQLGGGGKP